MYNIHTHTFNINHVPNRFISWLPLSIVRKFGLLKFLIKHIPTNWGRLGRLASMLSYINDDGNSKEPSQEDALKKLIAFYPPDTCFAVLSMDMEYMGAGKPTIPYLSQLDELAQLKSHPDYQKILLPFVFADPRRPNILELVKDCIENKGFSGIKLYPALGYYPFDWRLFPVYDYALAHDIPITSHCIAGVVHYKGEITSAMRIHPATGKELIGQSNFDFTQHYTDTENYQILMSQTRLQEYLDKERKRGADAPAMAPDYQALKINLAHFGGEDQWRKYIETPYNPYFPQPNTNWFSTIRDMILSNQFPNVYADISYTLSDAHESVINLLKIIVQQPILQDRILFGTDFFLVERVTNEREFSLRVRATIGEEAFHRLSETNPTKFLQMS